MEPRDYQIGLVCGLNITVRAASEREARLVQEMLKLGTLESCGPFIWARPADIAPPPRDEISL